MTYESRNIQQTWFDGALASIQPNNDWKDFDNLPTTYNGWKMIKPGKASGRILGGNFGSFVQLQGTDFAPDVAGAIFFVETYKAPKKAIHQLFTEFRMKGYLEKLAGLVVGYCLGSDNSDIEGNEQPMKDLLLEVTDGYSFPVMQIGEVGHNVDNIMLPIGAQATIDAANLHFSIDEAVVL